MFRLNDKHNAWTWLESAQVKYLILKNNFKNDQIFRKREQRSLVLLWLIVVQLI
jgi:hypothetical protein